jgi:3-carboxy-cis,cis-muconate cycloisomerase
MSDLLERLFGDPEVTGHFTPRAQLQALLDFELALARALVDAGAIPAVGLEPVERCADARAFDVDELARETVRSGNPVIPLVTALTARVAAVDEGAARYIHWGATSQDALDTGLVLQLRGALAVVAQRLRAAESAAASLASRHARTVMPGRTWLQHATPITFGLKAAGWCEAIRRVTDRLEGAGRATMVLQFGGAAGTLASLGGHGPVVARALGERLGLAVPALPWHSHRDRVADLACAVGVVAGCLGKIGRDLALLAQTEVAEAHEATPGGSSTMPQKRNPVAAAVAISAAHRAPGLVATMLSAMPQEHERGIGGWQAEWETVPELVRLTGGAARAIAGALETLVVDPNRMRANLDGSSGLIHAEAVATELAGSLGRERAHHLVAEACRRAAAVKMHLRDVLAADPEITAHLPVGALHELFSADRYLGATTASIEAVLRQRRPESG